MGTPQKHAEIIKAWADGAQVEFVVEEGEEWTGYAKGENPSWDNNLLYRIKPEPKPDRVVFLNVYEHNGYRSIADAEEVAGSSSAGMLKLTFDGETGKLKDDEVLK